MYRMFAIISANLTRKTKDDLFKKPSPSEDSDCGNCATMTQQLT
jgi:hypothetical protein